jgi:hypothetical protein
MMTGIPPVSPEKRPRLRLPGVVAFVLYLLVIDALILLLLTDEAPYVIPVADVLFVAAYIVDGVRKRKKGTAREPHV